uniref:Repressor of RNA polymerase III transcription MAF1 homolog n=2 Tax=Plectus sambesii TaxID=2011161 RepID=A0A914V6S4_9BILA
MKYLESAKLEALNSALSVESDDCRLDVRLESYSCKMVQTDKRQWKRTFQPGTSPRDLQPLSPPVVDDPWGFPPSPNTPGCTPALLEAHTRARHRSDHSFSGSDDEGPVLRDSISRRTLFDLIAVLNTSFSDYDFSDAKSDTFSLVPAVEVGLYSVVEDA